MNIKRFKLGSFNFASILVSILFPIGGLIILLIIKFRSKLFIEEDSKNEVDIETDDNGYYFLPEIDVEKDSDIIALEDSLFISDLSFRRKTVLNILKRDVNKYSKFINQAIKNEDTETVHYVATSILNTRIKLDSQLKKLVKAYEENPSDIKAAASYFNLLTKRLSIPYLENNLKAYYTNVIIEVLRNIVDNKLSTDESFISNLLKFLVEVKDYNSIRYYCNYYDSNYSSTEEKYLSLLQGYYVAGDELGFKNTLLKLVKDNINLSKEAIEIVSFWLGGRL